MLTEAEYLDIAEHYQRAVMGDTKILAVLFDHDIPRLLADWREWQRLVGDLREVILTDPAALTYGLKRREALEKARSVAPPQKS
jgi:hypothetical protein